MGIPLHRGRIVSAALPSLEDQAARWHELDASEEAKFIRENLMFYVARARYFGLRVEVKQVSHAPSMGATHEEITVTPSRDGYQSTT